ncbi:MAG: sigma-54-dependent Fis family transcriptional regulator [Sandaracinus sp.]|nr:sigma-54-dependent Fis family transcriptional regulator [Sandaracinus sp.]
MLPPAMTDAAILERWEALRGVRVARAILEEAWGASLVLTGAEGPLAHQRGGVLRAASPVCRTALFTREGFARCDAFYRRAAGAGDPLRCHLGLGALAEPVHGSDGRVLGRVVASGFGEGPETPARPELARALCDLGPPVEPAEATDAVRRLPIVDARMRRPVRALLRAAAAEIAAHEADRRARRGDAPGLWGMVGRSPQMEAVFELLPRLAESDATALVLGESGTGKELVARALHEHGRRSEAPFVAQNCAAMTDELLESTLFGHVRGAFSGAVQRSEGLFGAADGGTLFLDEVGDMSPALQVKLLRVLQDGSYLPVGATSPRRADVRVVAATHKDLTAAVRDGRFRQDLYYRLHVLPVELPPLRDRVGDVRLLVEHFLAEREGGPPRVSDAAWECLERYRWPGNVRELRAEVMRWQLTAGDAPEVGPEHLGAAIREAGGYASLAGNSAALAAARGEATLAEAVESLERAIIERGLERTGGNRTQLARELDISRTTLADRLKRYGLE